MVLCGMTSPDGTVDRQRDADILKKGLALVDQIFLELFYIERPWENPPAKDGLLLEGRKPIPLSVRAVNDIMPYGVAMLLAGSAGDVNAQSRFAMIYNQKRQSARRRQERIHDRLPAPYMGG